MSLLPRLPGHRLRIRDDARPPVEDRGFIYVRKLQMVALFADGSESEPFPYFCADRSKMDAVVVVPHFTDEHGVRHVFLRSALRPPVYARPMEIRPIVERDSLGELWEVPAGLVEADEQTPEGLVACARRELFEETGFDVSVATILALGPPSFPAPGMIGERHFFFHTEVDPRTRVKPSEDGSVLEREASVESVRLDVAIEACRRGEIEDAKTELALRRLAEL
jgi:ADP-ribose pyrophosphatase